MRAVVRTSRASSALLVASLLASTAIPAMQVAAAPAEPRHVTLVLIASRDAEPVSDLQPGDIEVFDDGVPQPVAALEYVDTVTGDAPEPPGDFVLVLDDLGTPRSGTGSAIALGLGLVDALGPADRLAIVNTGPFPLTHQLSTDRASARTTVRQFIGQQDTAAKRSRSEACRRSVVSLGVIENALKVIAQQPGSRRAMLVVSDGQRAYWGDAQHERCSEARKVFDRVIAASSVASVPIYATDVPGQQEAAPHDADTLPRAAARGRRPSGTPRGTLGMLTAATGGTVNGAPRHADSVDQMVRDSRQYYRVTYRQPEMSRGSRKDFRQILVRVRRQGVAVRARELYVPS